MLFKTIITQVVLVTTYLGCNLAIAHQGGHGHEHSGFEQFLSGLGYAAAIISAAVIIKILFNSKSENL